MKPVCHNALLLLHWKLCELSESPPDHPCCSVSSTASRYCWCWKSDAPFNGRFHYIFGRIVSFPPLYSLFGRIVWLIDFIGILRTESQWTGHMRRWERWSRSWKIGLWLMIGGPDFRIRILRVLSLDFRDWPNEDLQSAGCENPDFTTDHRPSVRHRVHRNPWGIQNTKLREPCGS